MSATSASRREDQKKAKERSNVEARTVTNEKPKQQRKRLPYTVGVQLGKGAYGSVYGAMLRSDVRVGEHYEIPHDVNVFAVKKVTSETVFVKEAAIVQKIRDHQPRIENVVAYYGTFQGQGHSSILMEKCTFSLDTMLKSGFDILLANKLYEEMMKALAKLHGIDIIHRDVKPPNILLRETGSFALCDVGVAMIEPRSSGRSGTTAGTEPYMHPAAVNLSHRSCDFYSLGATMIDVLVCVMRTVDKEHSESWRKWLKETTPKYGELADRTPYVGALRHSHVRRQYRHARDLNVNPAVRRLAKEVYNNMSPAAKELMERAPHIAHCSRCNQMAFARLVQPPRDMFCQTHLLNLLNEQR